MRVIVGGYLGLLHSGGVSWDYLQYPLGLHLMGHDVYYIEDTRLYPIYQKPGSNWGDASNCVAYLKGIMQRFGMSDRWCYRDETSGNCYGMTKPRLLETCDSADVFINISCSTVMRDEYFRIPNRILIDSDPMFTQIQLQSSQLFTPGVSNLGSLIDQHNLLFSFGENIGKPDCLIPMGNRNWNTTRQPICLQHWERLPFKSHPNQFTTLMNLRAAKPLEYEGQTWGQKDIEFEKFLQIPTLVPDAKFKIVVNKTGGNLGSINEDAILAHGWQLINPDQVSSIDQYQQFIAQSQAEFSVAKETYIKSLSGWFSCRSACYLAASRPVITQDTGWSNYYPTGRGLHAFTNLGEALNAIEAVRKNPSAESAAAKEIAQEYFNYEIVLKNLLSVVK